MRQAAVLVFLVLLQAPSLAQGHAGVHGGNETHGEGAGELKPGAWPPPNGTAPNTTAPAPAPAGTPVSVVGFEPTVSSPATREWYGFKGDPGRTGATGAKAPLAPQRKWDATGTANVGIFAPPVVADGVAVFAGLDRKVHAVNVATGFRAWAAPVALPAMAYASPAIADDKVLVQAVDGTLLALDLATGAEKWRVALGDKASAAPLVHNGVVVALTEGGKVQALDIGDGKPRWNRTLGPVQSTVAPMMASGRIVIGDARGTVWGLHALTGQTLWTASLAAPVTATPVLAGKLVVVPTLGLRALELETGKVVWSRAMAGFVRSSPAHQAGVVVYGDPEAPGVHALSAQTGQPVWEKAVPTRLFVRSAPTIAQDVAVAAADDGSILAMRLRNGTLLWTLDAGANMRASPVVLDGRLFAARMDGVLRLYEDPAVDPAADPGSDPGAGGDRLLDLLPIFVALAVPYVGLKVARERMRQALAPPALAPLDSVGPPAEARAAAEQAARRGYIRVPCARCGCRFGVAPRQDRIVQCPGCGLRSEVRRKRRSA